MERLAVRFVGRRVYLQHPAESDVGEFLETVRLSEKLHRPWAETLKGKPVTEQWLAQQLRPYGVKPRTLWLNGAQAKGYFSEEFTDISQRYISQSELDALKQESEEPPSSATNNGFGQTAAL